MPESEYGGSFTSWLTPRRGRDRHYRTIAPVSEVDESLFGFSNAFNKDAKRQTDTNRKSGFGEMTTLEREAAERNRGRRRKEKTKKETVQIVTKDQVRSLVVPEVTDAAPTLVLRSTDYERIKDSARFISEQKREAERLRAIQEEELGMETRRTYMKSLDLNRQRAKQANESEADERRKQETLTQKAIEKLREQEEEIKRLNELIHGAKILSTRDAEIGEKRAEVKGERFSDDRRNTNRRIGEQIEENEQDRLLEIDRRDVENREMRKRFDRLCEEEDQRVRKHRREQEELMETLDRCNADLQRRRQFTKEEEKLLERRVVELQRQKAEREEAFQRDISRIRMEKDRELVRLRAFQDRFRDDQAERNAVRARRAEERMELEWRQKRALEEKRKMENTAMLDRARAEQLRQRRHYLEVQAQRERAEFERVLRAQEELRAKQNITDETKFQRRKEFSEGLRVQVRERERSRSRERDEFLGEPMKVDDELTHRSNQLEEIKRQKLQELRDAGIHEKYVSQIERRSNQRDLVAI